jgi:hypothetical protein
VSQGDASTGTSGAPTGAHPVLSAAAAAATMVAADEASGLSPRISPQPVHLSVKPGEERMWAIVGMDLDGLTTTQLTFHYDPRTIDVAEITFGPAMHVNLQKPPVVKIDANSGTITITSSDATPLSFNSGGDIAGLRVRGAAPGETYLVMDNPTLKNGRGEGVASAVSGGRARVE